MRNTYKVVCILSLFFYVFAASYALATTNIDTSFGEDGFTLQDFEIGNDEGYAVAVQEDEKILVAGYSYNGAVKNLVVSRFLADGTLDSNFNAAGYFSISLGSGDTIGRSLAVQADGTIIVGASTYDAGAKVAILKLTTEGNLDTSFGASDGYVIIPVEDGEITSTAVQLNSSEEIFVSATMEPEASNSYALFAKLESTGEFDASFGDDGQTTYKDSSNDIRINSLLLQTSGTILAGGSLSENEQPQAILLQLTENGEVDTTYGSEGRLSLDLGGTSSVINSIAAASDDSIIVAGAINNGEYNEAFVGKRSSDGSTVVEFASSGTYTTTYSLESMINAVSLTEDGTILAVGFMTSANSKDIFLLSLEESSEAQTTAVTFIATDIAQNDDIGYAAVALDNDTILTAGSSSNGNDLDLALLRFTSDESLLTAGSTTDSTEGVITSGFRITTISVESITRVSAVSGGIIEQFSNSEEGVTVSQKGVVFATHPNPAYSVDEDGEEETDDATSTESTTDSNGGIFPDSHSSYIVTQGSTNDGEGIGSYITDVTDITPGTTYFLRAYAVLSDGSVLYGNEYRFTTDDSCFIATAAYGSILDKHVIVLRQFRDKYLLTNKIGQRFVATYYATSPPIADYIRNSNVLKTIVKIGLFPLVLLAMFFVKTTLATKLLCLAAGLIFSLMLSIKYYVTHRVTAT